MKIIYILNIVHFLPDVFKLYKVDKIVQKCTKFTSAFSFSTNSNIVNSDIIYFTNLKAFCKLITCSSIFEFF